MSFQPFLCLKREPQKISSDGVKLLHCVNLGEDPSRLIPTSMDPDFEILFSIALRFGSILRGASMVLHLVKHMARQVCQDETLQQARLLLLPGSNASL
jgi:hypothetical protein